MHTVSTGMLTHWHAHTAHTSAGPHLQPLLFYHHGHLVTLATSKYYTVVFHSGLHKCQKSVWYCFAKAMGLCVLFCHWQRVTMPSLVWLGRERESKSRSILTGPKEWSRARWLPYSPGLNTGPLIEQTGRYTLQKAWKKILGEKTCLSKPLITQLSAVAFQWWSLVCPPLLKAHWSPKTIQTWDTMHMRKNRTRG